MHSPPSPTVFALLVPGKNEAVPIKHEFTLTAMLTYLCGVHLESPFIPGALWILTICNNWHPPTW